MSTASLSLVIPMYREAGNVLPLVACVHRALDDYPARWELVLVNDGSRDATAHEMEQARAQWGRHVRLLHLPRNQGQTAAMQAGIDAARGEVIATLDGDGQNDPADIPSMVSHLLDHDLDLVCGRRSQRQDHYLSRKLPSRLANRLIRRVTGVRISDYGCSLKVYRSKVIRRVRLYGEMHRLIPVWAAMVTDPARIGEMPVSHHPRTVGRSKYGISRTFRVLLDLLTAFFFLRFQARPGHFFGGLGLAFGAVGASMLGWLGICKFILGESIGTRPMLTAGWLMMMFSVQFLCTGLLAEMVTRIFHQGRPLALDETHPVQDLNSGWHPPSIARPASTVSAATHA